jgi:hypothetical protein
MKTLLKIIILLTFYSTYGQDIEYGGTYAYGSTPDIGRTGIIYVYPNSDSTLLFYLELNRGTPSYNIGAIVGQMNIYSHGEADFTMVKENDFINCSMNFWFNNDSLFVRTNDQAYDCGYGHAVFSDGDFKKTKKEIPLFFIDMSGKKIWFKYLAWKKWWD